MTRLYFLHIPKTAGSSITRLLEDAWPAGALAPQRFVDEIHGDGSELSAYAVVAGHLGTVAATSDRQVVTLLRDPVQRAWSHYKAYGERFDSFSALLDDPVRGWIARDYQARWLAVPPEPGTSVAGELPPGSRWRGGSEATALAGEELEARALATLHRCVLVGTVERIDEFVSALARVLGRALPAPPRLNVGDGDRQVPPAEAGRVRRQSRVDARLHALAEAELDRALAALPEVPAEPAAPLPYRQTMSDPLCGTEWHPRVHTVEAGWHRWTGPGTRTVLRLPIRATGRAQLDLAILSACDDDAVRSLRLSVQGRPVERRFEDRSIGISVVADVELDVARPLTIELEVSHTRRIASPDPAGLAVGDVVLEAAR